MNNYVILKGKKDRLSIHLNNEVDFLALRDSLVEKVKEARSFIGQGQMAIEFTNRKLSELEENVLIDLIKSNSDLNITYVFSENSGDSEKIKFVKAVTEEGKEVSSPYIDECPVNIECKVKSIIPLGTHDLFLAEVLCSHIDEKLIDENGKIHFEWANLITYSHGEYFPVPKTAIGSFGYSVAKQATIERKKAIAKTNSSTKKKKDKIKEKTKKKGRK